MSQQAPLTVMQKRVLEAIASGAADKQIAQGLFISRATVGYHVAQLMRIFGAKNRPDLVARAFVAGNLDASALPVRATECLVVDATGAETDQEAVLASSAPELS